MSSDASPWTRHAVENSKSYGREQELRAALDGFIADYGKHRAVSMADKGGGACGIQVRVWLARARWLLSGAQT